MSAEALGARLLAEVQEEGLDEFLSGVRRSIEPQKSELLGLPVLDRLLDIFSRRAAQAPRRPRWSSPDENENGESTYRHDHDTVTPPRNHGQNCPPERRRRHAVIELTSQISASGKTHLLYYVTALAVLPSIHGGKASAVVWIDNDGRFSATRLREVMLHHLSKQASSAPEAQRQSIARDALQHIHVFHPQSSDQLIATLATSPAYLLDLTVHHSATRALKAVVLDSITAFYWQDRYAAELARLEAGPTSSDHANPSFTKTLEAIKLLRGLQKEFDCAVLFSSTPTTSPTSSGRQAATSTTPRQHAPPQEPARTSLWTTYATITLTLSRVPVPQFASHMPLEECLRDRENRYTASSKGRFVAVLDLSGSDSWGTVVRDAVARLEGKGSFGMNVTEEGVVVE